LTVAGHRARCFGQDWLSDIELEQFDPLSTSLGPDPIIVQRTTHLDPVEPLLHRVGRAEIGASGFRFSWNDEACFDMRGTNQIDWLAGPRWTGTLPASFYSSVAAMTLAMRGFMPLHVSSIIFGKHAWLVAGAAGAGKSTLVAELLAAGGRLLSDDLTILAPDADGDAPLDALRGRPAMRLHPETARQIDSTRVADVPDDPRGKLLVWPKARAADARWPIAGAFVMRGESLQTVSTVEAAALFGNMIFRPKILAKLAGHVDRRKLLLNLAQRIPLYRFPQLAQFDEKAQQSRAEMVLSLVARAT
jgi:hypothetical protein